MDKKKKCIIDEYKTVYGFSLFVIINPDKSVIDKRFSFRDDDTSIIDDEWASYTAYTTRGAFDKESNEDCEVIVINRLKGDNSDVNTFAHEAFHAAADILEACHIKFTDDTNEVYAYLIGYLTECITQTANKEWISLRWVLYYIMPTSYLYNTRINRVQNSVNISLYMEYQWI